MLCSVVGEKMTEEECEMVFQGHEDAQGNVNYEGKKVWYLTIFSSGLCEEHVAAVISNTSCLLLEQ